MCAHLRKHVQNTGARQVDAHIFEEKPTALDDAPADKEIRRRTDVPRHRDFLGRYVILLPRDRIYACRASFALYANAESREHPLGMIPRDERLRHGRGRIRIQPREEDRGFHLRAGNGTVVRNAAQFLSCGDNAERQIIVVVPAVDPRAHLSERQEDAPHRTARERRVSRKRQEKGLRSEQPHHQPQRRSRVPGIKYGRRFGESMEAAPRHNEFAVRGKLDADAKRAHDADRRQTVRRMEKILDMNRRASKTREHHTAVRNRFIARNHRFSPPSVDGGGNDLHLRHRFHSLSVSSALYFPAA